MKEVICEEVAQETLSGWLSELEAELTVESRATLIKRIKTGRLDYADSVFTLGLIVPVKLENGSILDKITISEPNGKMVADISKRKSSDEEAALRLISTLSGQPLGVIERIGQRDLNAAAVVLSFFG